MIFNYVTDSLFFVDILINFNCAYQTPMYEIIDDRKTITKSYMTGWFFIDLIAITPFSVIFDLFATSQGEG